MNKTVEAKNSITMLKSEISDIALLYNMHKLEVQSIFNKALVLTYSLDPYEHIAALGENNQILFYSVKEKKIKIINLSLVKYKLFYKKFIKLVAEKNAINITNEFYRSLSKSNFQKVQIEKLTNRKVILEVHDKSHPIAKNISFEYKILTRDEYNFISSQKDIWIYSSQEHLKKLLKNKNYLDKKINIKCDIFDHRLVKKMADNVTKKILKNTKGKMAMKVSYANRKSKVLHIKSNMYITKQFIEYIQEYIYTNTLYEVNFVN